MTNSANYYSVTGTDVSDYAHWQCELLEHTWREVGQPGELIRLVALADDKTLPVHRHTRVFQTAFTNVHPVSGDEYVPYNRLFSLREWLREDSPDGTVLLLDPDCVFRNALPDHVEPGAPIAQYWYDFYGMPDEVKSLTTIPDDELQPITWPAIVHSEDLRLFMPRWIDWTARIRDLTGAWESDMFAFILAAAEVGLNFEVGTTTAWLNWPEDVVAGAPIIHYCQPVFDDNGKQLWFKQGYKPWSRIGNPEEARFSYCRDLMRIIQNYIALRRQTETIFVALAAYREPELRQTIEDCVAKAARPEALRFGVVLQYDPEGPADVREDCLEMITGDVLISVLKYHYRYARGTAWARHQVQTLYGGERYTLQIDAHTRMVPEWDTQLIKMLHEMPSDKPIISGFPPLYFVDEQGEETYQHNENLDKVGVPVVKQWPPEGWVHHPTEYVDIPSERPWRSRFLSGAFLFTQGQWNREVIYDPEMYFSEEFSMTLRSFSQGYDLFTPTRIMAWHRGHMKPNPKVTTDFPDQDRRLHAEACRRLRLLYSGDPGGELEPYGLGSQRSLDDFYRYSGLNCADRSIHPHARDGIPPNPVTVQSNTLSETREKPVMQDNGEQTEEPVELEIDVTVRLKDSGPYEFVCDINNPVLGDLFRALAGQAGAMASQLLYLQIGEDDDRVVYFPASQIVLIETSPPIDPSAFL